MNKRLPGKEVGQWILKEGDSRNEKVDSPAQATDRSRQQGELRTEEAVG